MANVFTEAAGMPTEYADTSLDEWSYFPRREGDTVLRVTGGQPIQFSTFAKSVRHVWE